MVEPALAFDKVIVNVSGFSAAVSSVVATLIVFVTSLARKLSAPDVAVKSVPDVAVPPVLA
jgi:hypothetical protein